MFVNIKWCSFAPSSHSVLTQSVVKVNLCHKTVPHSPFALRMKRSLKIERSFMHFWKRQKEHGYLDPKIKYIINVISLTTFSKYVSLLVARLWR